MTRVDGKQRRSGLEIFQHPVVVLGGAMIVVQILIRGWALQGSFFHTDDYRLLSDAQSQQLSVSYLLEPFDSQFMPLGRLLAWAVAESGQLNWTLAAITILLIQLLASLACLTMLVVLFGPRWGILTPLGIYLTSVITLPAFMWWAAALNQLPLQLAFFGAVTAWILYLRSSSTWWLAVVTLAVLFGLLSYIKALLILPVLAALMLGWFSSGSALDRVRDCLRRYWPSAVALSVVPGAFAIYYALRVPQVFSGSPDTAYNPFSIAGDLADSMLASSLATGVVGGPWHWFTSNPPLGYADPPAWFIGLAWVTISGAVAVLFLVRERIGRVFLLLAGYALLAYLLVLTGDARVAGAFIGTDLRYLTDVLPVFVLAIGLASMQMRGSREPSRLREHPLLTLRLRPWVIPVITLLIFGSGLWNTVTYVRTWHQDNPGAEYVRNLRSDVAAGRPIDMADHVVPAHVVPANIVPGFSTPYNTTRRFLPLVSDNFRFPSSTSQLMVVNESGDLRKALIEAVVTTREGPAENCGWHVKSHEIRSIPLTSTLDDFDGWIRIGYLSSAAGPVSVEAGQTTVEARVQAGVGSLYLQVSGPMNLIRISGLEGNSELCVDTAEVGAPIAAP